MDPPVQRGGREHRIFASLCLAVAAMAMMTLAFEAYLRLTFSLAKPSGCQVASKDLVWVNRPGCGEINSLGFRDREYGIDKPRGVVRIVVIGDSVVEGWGVRREQTFGKRLEASLNALGRRPVEVILVAVGGYTLRQELTLLRERAFSLDPDVILWSYCFNDPVDPRHHSIMFNVARLGEHHAWSEPSFHVQAFLSQRFFLLREKIRGRGCPSEYHRFYHCAYRPEIERGIAEIASLSEERGIPVVFLIHPLYHRGAFANYAFEDLHASMRGIVEKNGLPAYDLIDVFRGRRAAEVGLTDASGRVDLWHPGRRGHAAIADHLFVSLENDGHIDLSH